MNNKLFGKATALVMGSLMVFSGQALATSYNNQEFTDADAFNDSEIVIADASVILPLSFKPKVAQTLAIAASTLGDATAIAQSDAIGGKGQPVLAESIAKATAALGNATALANSRALTRGGAAAIAKSLADATTFLGDATAIATSDAISGPGKPALARSLANAETAMGGATAIAIAVAR